MSFTLNKQRGAKEIAKISGGIYNGLIVYYIDKKLSLENNNKHKYLDFVSLTLEDGCEFTPYPDTSLSRQVVACFGCSGCGKSYFCKKYLKNYSTAFPKNDMFIITPFHDDESLLDLKNLQKIKLDKSWVSDPVLMDDLPENSALMIDDLDVYNEADVKKQVEILKGAVNRGGRHKGITMLITEHVSGTADKETRNLILESHLIVIYLSSGGNYENLLKKYIGLSTKQIEKLKRMDSRWICLMKAYPSIWYSENQIGFIKDL